MKYNIMIELLLVLVEQSLHLALATVLFEVAREDKGPEEDGRDHQGDG